MSLPFSSIDVSSKPKITVIEDDDEDSVLELGQIAILGASRPSLKYFKSTTDINASKRSLASRQTAGNLNNSRFFVSKFGSRNESILAASVVDAATDQCQDVLNPAVDSVIPEPIPACLLCYNIKGYIYGIISALVFVLSQVIMRRSIWLSGPDHVFIRLALAFLIFYTYLKYKNLNVLGPRKQFKLLMFRGFLGKVFNFYWIRH